MPLSVRLRLPELDLLRLRAPPELLVARDAELRLRADGDDFEREELAEARDEPLRLPCAFAPEPFDELVLLRALREVVLLLAIRHPSSSRRSLRRFAYPLCIRNNPVRGMALLSAARALSA
jgi:hypothetical protein